MTDVSQPQRLAFCITDLDPGGAERALVQLAKRLDRQHWSPRVYCLSGPGALVNELSAAEVPVTCLGARNILDFRVIIRLYRELKQWSPSVLQTFLFHANIAGRLAGWWAGVPHIVSGIRVAERRSRFYLWADRLTNRLVEQNVCVSRSVADFSISEGGLPPNKVTVIPNGVDAQRYAQAEPANLNRFEIPTGSRTIATVARLDRQKGLLFLLQSAETLVAEFEDVHVLIVGEGNQRGELEKWIADRHLEKRVHLAGWQPEIPQLLKASYCFVLPSLWEGLPNVLLEAMAAGLPVVATQVEGSRELIQDGETGLLVPPHSSEELTTALRTLLNSPETARELGTKSQVIVQNEFTWEAMASAYEALYRRLLEK